jgi:oligopeptide transport system substrate-binding protein
MNGVLFFIIALLTACSSGINNDKVKVFRYNQSSGISSLDPAFAKDQACNWAAAQLYNCLLQTNDQLQIQPDLAQTWTISPDGLTYTFHLRNDVFFHDHPLFQQGKGRRMVAADVVHSLSRLIDKTVASPGAWLFEGKLNPQTPFEAPNDSTFILHLNKPFQPMLGILTMPYCSVVPHEITQHYGKDFRTNPVGTGAFQFKIWRENEVLILVRNPHYFERDTQNQALPYLDGIKITFMDNKRNEYLKFAENKLDFLSGLDASYKDDLLNANGELLPEWKNKIKLLRTPYLNTEYLGILQKNNKTNVLNNKLIRQAINYGFDRQKMVRYLRNNVGVAAENGFVPPVMPPFNAQPTKGYQYNPQKAIQLLQQANYGKNKNEQPITIETNATYQEFATFIQKQLSEIGMKIEVNLNPPSLLREKAAKGEADFFRASWIGDYPDPETYLAVLYGKHTAPPNYTRFDNPQYNQLYEQALNESNDKQRYALYSAMDSIIIAESPIIPLYYDEVLRFVGNRVTNMGINPFNALSLKAVDIKIPTQQ